MIKALIFDFGGVILKTEDRLPRYKLAEMFGMTFEEFDQLVFASDTAKKAAIGSLSSEQHWQQVCQALGISSEQKKEIAIQFFAGDKLDWELISYIRSKQRHYYTILLSNAWDDLRQYLKDEWKIADIFDEIIISAEVGLVKPQPEIYQLALSKFDLTPEQAIFIDDFDENVFAAEKIGLRAIKFKSSQQMIAELDNILVGAN